MNGFFLVRFYQQTKSDAQVIKTPNINSKANPKEFLYSYSDMLNVMFKVK